MLLYFLGKLCYIEAGLLVVPLLTGIIYREEELFSFGITIIITLIIGLCLHRIPKIKNKKMFAREGLATVGLAWILMSFIGALPFVISGVIPSFVDAFFETVSGFTTTGASILTEISSLPRSILLWRSFTHWIGGMGILVFILAIVPLGQDSMSHTMHLLRAESPGPTIEKLLPRMRSSTAVLYMIYIGLTLLEVIFLLIGGMPVYDSIVNSMATAGTGGFAVLNNSIAGYDSYYLQNVITIFMLLFGVNFNAYFLILMGDFKKVLKMEEVRWYFAIVAFSIITITINISSMYQTAYEAFHHSAFTVSSIITTTGFGTEDFNLWPEYSRMLLVLIMFVGACAGSTGGGIKVSRIIILVKYAMREVYKMVHPSTVRVIQIDKKRIDKSTIENVNVFLTTYLIVFVISILLLSLDGLDITTTVSAVVACLNNIGPGLELVGTTGNYSMFSDFGKMLLSLNMLIGRLEIFPILALFTPSLWKRRM